MNTVEYVVMRSNQDGIFEPVKDVITGVTNVRITDKYYIVEYFDGDAFHTRNIHTMLVETFEVK